MIVSHRYRFIFLKTRKTAGTSVEIALSRLCGPEDVITPLLPADEAVRRELGGRGPQHYQEGYSAYGLGDWWRLLRRRRPKLRFYHHIGAAEARAKLGPEVWDGYFKFCFERNPWDKAISYYYHRQRKRPGPHPSFAEFVLAGGADEVSDFDHYSIDGRVAMDFIGRYENLEHDLEEVRRRIGLPGPLRLPVTKGGFRQDRRAYQEIYGEAEKARVARAFAREIDHFGYLF
jgi:hypothetical protein